MNTEVLQVVQEKDPWIVKEGVVSTHGDDRAAWISLHEETTATVDKKGRRKSWHAIKFDRKRRKGVVEQGAPPVEARQKRPSWWNIFANQQWPRYTQP